MYRYEVDADGVESDPVKLNETLIIEDTDESTTGVYYTILMSRRTDVLL